MRHGPIKLAVHSFDFLQKEYGESLIFTTTIYDNGDFNEDSMFLTQEIKLQSSETSASINISGITPGILRNLANELESEIFKAKEKRHNLINKADLVEK